MLLLETAIARSAGMGRCVVVSFDLVFSDLASLTESITCSLLCDPSLYIYLSDDHRCEQYHVGRVGTDQSEPRSDLLQLAIHLRIVSATLQCC